MNRHDLKKSVDALNSETGSKESVQSVKHGKSKPEIFPKSHLIIPRTSKSQDGSQQSLIKVGLENNIPDETRLLADISFPDFFNSLNNSSSLEDNHVNDLLLLLQTEQHSKQALNSLVTELQKNYNELLVKYAKAENFIDRLKCSHFHDSSCLYSKARANEVCEISSSSDSSELPKITCGRELNRLSGNNRDGDVTTSGNFNVQAKISARDDNSHDVQTDAIGRSLSGANVASFSYSEASLNDRQSGIDSSLKNDDIDQSDGQFSERQVNCNGRLSLLGVQRVSKNADEISNGIISSNSATTVDKFFCGNDDNNGHFHGNSVRTGINLECPNNPYHGSTRSKQAVAGRSTMRKLSPHDIKDFDSGYTESLRSSQSYNHVRNISESIEKLALRTDIQDGRQDLSDSGGIGESVNPVIEMEKDHRYIDSGFHGSAFSINEGSVRLSRDNEVINVITDDDISSGTSPTALTAKLNSKYKNSAIQCNPNVDGTMFRRGGGKQSVMRRSEVCCTGCRRPFGASTLQSPNSSPDLNEISNSAPDLSNSIKNSNDSSRTGEIIFDCKEASCRQQMSTPLDDNCRHKFNELTSPIPNTSLRSSVSEYFAEDLNLGQRANHKKIAHEILYVKRNRDRRKKHRRANNLEIPVGDYVSSDKQTRDGHRAHYKVPSVNHPLLSDGVEAQKMGQTNRDFKLNDNSVEGRKHHSNRTTADQTSRRIIGEQLQYVDEKNSVADGRHPYNINIYCCRGSCDAKSDSSVRISSKSKASPTKTFTNDFGFVSLYLDKVNNCAEKLKYKSARMLRLLEESSSLSSSRQRNENGM